MPAVHYNVRFTLKERIEEGYGLAVVEGFLRSLCELGEVSAFRIQKNEPEGSPITRPHYLARIEFSDDAAFERAM